MSEEQGKHIKRWYKKRSNILMLATAVVVISGIVAFAWIDSRDGLGPDRADASYITVKEQLQNSVIGYQDSNNGTLPTLNGTVDINGSVYRIFDVCSFLVSQGGALRFIPEGIWGNSSTDDNCAGGCDGCRATNHYVWAVDDNGSVYSTCVGDACKAHNQNGYQDVWP